MQSTKSETQQLKEVSNWSDVKRKSIVNKLYDLLNFQLVFN